MRRWLSVLVLGLFAGLPRGALAAQALARVAPGDRARVESASLLPPRVAGRVVGADGVGIRLVPDGDSAARTIAWGTIRRLDVSLGARTAGEGFLRGAGVGFLVGAGTGAVATTAVYLSDADESCGDCFFPPTAAALALSVAGIAVTTLVGGLLGAANPGERWARVPLYAALGAATIPGRALALGVRVPLPASARPAPNLPLQATERRTHPRTAAIPAAAPRLNGGLRKLASLAIV